VLACGVTALARPSPLAVLRTLRCVCIDLPRLLGPMAMARWAPPPTTADAAGLARLRRLFTQFFDRLDLRFTVGHAERLPAHGGHVLMWNQTSHLDHLILALAIRRRSSACG
jgi:hypothetical protein